MSVTQIPFPRSLELEKEMSFFSETPDGEKIFSQFKTSEDLIRHVETSFEYLDITRIPLMFPPSRVLDVGVAYGLTSAYLALKGFDVTCVEPALKLCEDMDQNFSRLGIKIQVMQGIGEVLDQIKGPFDLVVFYSSLHHCDDMDKTLSGARQILAPGGKIFLFEPVLKFYRSKAWFFRQMEEHPEKVGHYGGNEHIYRTNEYINYLKKAGFINITMIPSLTYTRVPKKAPWDNLFLECENNFVEGPLCSDLAEKPIFNQSRHYRGS
jgi:2-polyprenyl-3-methyl-5-hydroxy-6-metoxy-1,4-benzoquinol methylase